MWSFIPTFDFSYLVVATLWAFVVVRMTDSSVQPFIVNYCPWYLSIMLSNLKLLLPIIYYTRTQTHKTYHLND